MADVASITRRGNEVLSIDIHPGHDYRRFESTNLISINRCQGMLCGRFRCERLLHGFIVAVHLVLIVGELHEYCCVKDNQVRHSIAITNGLGDWCKVIGAGEDMLVATGLRDCCWLGLLLVLTKLLW